MSAYGRKTLQKAYHHTSTQLDNGLVVSTVEMPHLHSAGVFLFARVGSRHESATTNGLSHFLEHMFFRGCDGFPDSSALNTAMEDLGGVLEGYTTRDHSGYHSIVHPDHLEEATSIFGQMFSRPHFKNIEIERGIILEETLDAVDERGRQIELDVIAHQANFPDHGLGQSIDGPRKNLRGFQLADLEKHRRRFYGAQNMVLLFTGAIDAKRCRRAARHAFGDLFPGRAAADGRPPKHLPGGPAVKFIRTDDAQTRIRLSFRTVPDTHTDHLPLLMLRRILDGGLSSRIQTELVEKRGIAYDIGADITTYSDCGLFEFELAVAHRKLAYAIEELGNVIVPLVKDTVGREELGRVRRRMKIGLEFSLDSLHELAQWFGLGRLFARHTTPEQRLRALNRVSATEIQKVAATYLRPERMTLTGVGGASPAVLREAKAALAKLSEQLK